MTVGFKKYAHPGGTFINISTGNIVEAEVDAIVNAANHTLLGGGGVDGVIHQAAGPLLKEKCKTLGGCKTGEAKITKGYNLPAKYIIHTVGPIYGQENGQEAKLLANCYLNSIKLAYNHGLKSIVFPSISTGAFGYPAEEAAEVVVNLMLYLNNQQKEIFNHFDQISFIFASEEQREIFQRVFDKFYIVANSK